MIIWQGFGLLVPVIYFTVAVALQAVIEATGHVYADSFGPATSLVVSGAILYSLDTALRTRYHQNRPLQRHSSQVSPVPTNPKREDTLFWLPIRWWALLIFVAGIGYAIYQLIRPVS